MELIFHVHHANIPERMRERAATAVEEAARRLFRAVDAIIRFEQDGPVKRVEIVLHAPRQRDLIARGEALHFGTALTGALYRLTAQIESVRATRKTARRVTSAAKAATA